MANVIDIDPEAAKALQGETHDLDVSRGHFKPEWLSCQFMDTFFTKVDEINKAWEEATGDILLYARKAEDTARAKPPQTTHYRGVSGGSLEDGEITQEPIPDENIDFVIGSISLNEDVMVYETIGGESTILSPGTEYGILGITKDNGKYYYQIIDNTNNKTYFIEINDKLSITSDYDKILETTDKSIILTSTNIGEENFKRLTEPGECFLAKDDVEVEGVTFTSILDSDGVNYYIPRSNSVKVEPIDSVKKIGEL